MRDCELAQANSAADTKGDFFDDLAPTAGYSPPITQNTANRGNRRPGVKSELELSNEDHWAWRLTGLSPAELAVFDAEHQGSLMCEARSLRWQKPG